MIYDFRAADLKRSHNIKSNITQHNIFNHTTSLFRCAMFSFVSANFLWSTKIFLHIFYTSVSNLVLVHVTFGGERFPTYFPFIMFLSIVRFFMYRQKLRETFLKNFTFVRFHPNVCPNVGLQKITARDALLINMAFVRSLQYVPACGV